MTFIPGQKPSLPGTFLIVLLVASFAFLVCQPRTSTPSETGGEVSLVWEAWNRIIDTYVGVVTLDSKQAVGNMITSMLDAGEKPHYPFLTELGDVRSKPPTNVPRELTDFWKAWTLFREKWPDVDSKLLANAAVEGMLDTLGDPFAAHLSPEAYDRAQERLRGTYEGIGSFVAIQDDKIVLSPMKDSPAEKAGLKAGDVMLEVDGESVEGKSLQEVVEKVRGAAGSKVALLIERSDEKEPLEFNVFRSDISTSSVNRQLLPGAIAYIRISDFRENTPDDVLGIMEQFSQVDILALILDLRDNPGGSVESAHKVASQFLSKGLFMYEIDKKGQRKDWPIQEGGIATENLPIVVMVNEFTGSAAEAVAGALQDAQRAMILGTRTFGKGSTNVFKRLSDGSAIYIPVSHWYTPSGRLIQGTGIKPDIEVPLLSEDRASGIDAQLAEAYQYLNDKLPPFR